MSAEMTCLNCGAKKAGDLDDVLEWDKAHRVLCPDEATDRAPKTSTIRHAWAQGHPFPLTTDVEERYAEFDRWQAPHDAEVRAATLAEQGTEEPEPSAEDEFAPGECTGASDCDAPIHVHGCYRPHHANQCDSPDEYGHIEPQGEPSDAQVRAAALAMYKQTTALSMSGASDLARAALRAAAQVKP